MELAPEFFEAVLHRGTGERDPELGGEGLGRPGDLALGVLDVLGLVEHHGVPALGAQDVGVQAHDRVAGQNDIGVGVQTPARAVVDGNREAGPEALDLLAPVVDQAGGDDDQGTFFQGAEGLQGFAEPHVVGEQRAQAGLAKKMQPVDSLALVFPELRLEIVGQGGGRDALEVFEQGAQALKAGRRRLVEVFAKLAEVGQDAGGHLATLVPGRQ